MEFVNQIVPTPLAIEREYYGNISNNQPTMTIEKVEIPEVQREKLKSVAPEKLLIR